MASGGYAFGLHIREKHWKGKEKWVNCWQCWLMYSVYISLSAMSSWAIECKKNRNIKHNLLSTMNDVTTWILVIIGIAIPPVIAVWLDHYFNKSKKAAETEKIRLQNQITKDITYDQLKSESKHKNIKSKLEIFQRLINLEEEIRNKENKSASDQKKLESLEMIKKEFQETFAETKEAPKLVEEEKNLERKKVNGEEIKKLKPIKPTLKNQTKKKKKK